MVEETWEERVVTVVRGEGMGLMEEKQEEMLREGLILSLAVMLFARVVVLIVLVLMRT